MGVYFVAIALALVYATYEVAFEKTLPFALVGVVLFFSDFYFRLWKRPVRQARFFAEHFEISGWGVNLRSKYDQVEDLAKYRQTFGDFKSSSRVSFSVKGDPNLLIIPNRNKGGLDLYSWLLQKVPKSAVQRS